MTNLSFNPLKFIGAKAIAISAGDLKRAHGFYRDILSLEPYLEDDELVGYLLGDTIVMPKEKWYAPPSAEPNPRVTFEVESARATEAALRERGVTISDPVAVYGSFAVGSFLDSEGNKLWFCSELE